VNVLVLDACRDNPFSQGTRSIARGLARIDAPAGSIVAYSTAPGQVAQDGENGNSPYAAALAKHIAAPGLSLEDVFRKVRIDVSESTAGTQVPWEETSLTQEVVLAGAAPLETPAEPTPPPVDASSTVLSAHAYQVAVGSNTAEAYDAFIRQFPSATETPLALRNREMLNDEANWRKAVESNTIGAFKIYVTLHPAGVYLTEAQQRIASLSAPLNATPAVSTAPSPPPVQTLVLQVGYDIFGTDLKSIRDVSFDDCQSFCAADQSCVAVSYRADLQRCYPKSDATLAVRNAKVSYAIKPQAQNNLRTSVFEFLPQMDVAGTDIGEAKVADPQACLSLCESDQRCNAFAYAVNNKTCYFKSTFYDFANAPKVVSGVRRN
jgi:Caspase domain/PAN domain